MAACSRATRPRTSGRSSTNPATSWTRPAAAGAERAQHVKEGGETVGLCSGRCAGAFACSVRLVPQSNAMPVWAPPRLRPALPIRRRNGISPSRGRPPERTLVLHSADAALHAAPHPRQQQQRCRREQHDLPRLQPRQLGVGPCRGQLQARRHGGDRMGDQRLERCDVRLHRRHQRLRRLAHRPQHRCRRQEQERGDVRACGSRRVEQERARAGRTGRTSASGNHGALAVAWVTTEPLRQHGCCRGWQPRPALRHWFRCPLSLAALRGLNALGPAHRSVRLAQC